MSTQRRPRIVFLTQFYDPEPVYKGQRFAEFLARAGYEVEVVTGFPNYPGGKVYQGYRIRPWQRHCENGIAITRLALYPSHERSRFGRVLNYASFMLSAFAYLTFAMRKADLVHAYHPPLTVGLAAVASGIFRRHPVVLDIHDLWPDALPATGMVTHAGVLAAVDRACRWLYRRARHIVLHSEGFREVLLERGIAADRMTAITGWTNEDAAGSPVQAVPAGMRDLPGLKVLYAGNMGPAQALDTVLDAARLLQDGGKRDEVTFCLLGSGVSLSALRDRAACLGLRNVAFLPRVPPTEAGAYLSAADALLVHLRDDRLFRLNIPSKMQAYMLAGKPVLVGVPGEAARLAQAAGCGIAFPPEDPRALADAVLALRAMPDRARMDMGESGRAYYWRELSMEQGVARLTRVFARICNA